MRTLLYSIIWLAGTCCALAQQVPASVDNWSDLRAVVARCWTPPLGTEGSLVALQFLIRTDGHIAGNPRIIASKLTGPREAQEEYRAEALKALSCAFPLRVTESFGPILMQQVFRLRLVNTRPEPALQLGHNMTLFGMAMAH